ncbi:hypothetical protein JW911_02050 [Candidatus Peregrinibacteria bacterium]|nr:hypothetical protein [Candidatus Peregrinibacteria bacterium]
MFLVFTCIVILCANFLPIAEIDSIAYHLPIVSKLISTGSIWEVFHAGFVGPNTFFPANHESIQAFFAVQTGNMDFGYIVTFLSFLLLCSSLLDLGRKRVSKLFIFIIALSSASVPFLFNQFLNLQIDLFMFSLFGSAVALIVSSVVNKEKIDLFKACLVLGVMLGTKYNAVPQIIVLVPFLIFAFFYQYKSLKFIFWYPSLIFLPGIFWYIRNWIIAFNPIYPFGIDLGFINFEGHKIFIEDTVGTSLWSHITKDGILNAISNILNNGDFEIQLGKVSLLFFPVAILAVAGALIFIVLNRIKDKNIYIHRKWVITTFVLLLYVFLAEIFYYLNSPYTYTLWNQTIRYSSPIFALIPVFLILSAFYSRIIYIALFYFASGLLIYNILFKSFLFNPESLQLIHHKIALISDIHILLSIFIIILVITLFGFLTRLKRRNNLMVLFALLVISLLISIHQFQVSPHFTKHTEFDDVYLSKKIDIYSSILPHINKLRDLQNRETEKIALSGLTPYWLFEKEGYAPLYVNIDGCLDCQYFYYRNEDKSVRANPNEIQWKSALKTLDVKYLIVDFKSFDGLVPYEEEWAKNDTNMFTLLLKTDSISLYSVN